MRTYGQYCPIARTSELLAERWTPIIIRNLLSGCRTFGELLDGAPGISKALLAQRLELLADHGILTRQPSPSGRGGHYTLTEQGRELKAVTDAMGAWGARWLELEPQHIDAAYVLWATCKLVDPQKVPSKGLVARIDLADQPTERYWAAAAPITCGGVLDLPGSRRGPDRSDRQPDPGPLAPAAPQLCGGGAVGTDTD